MANRTVFLESFSSKYRKKERIRDEIKQGTHKKRRPNYDRQRSMKQAQWEDKEDER